MDRLIAMDVEAFVKQAMVEAEKSIRQVAQAVNAGRPGHVIPDSEMKVKEIGEELTRRLLQQAAQARIDSSESSFSPSQGRGGRADAE